jgi:hypothetical protein
MASQELRVVRATQHLDERVATHRCRL